jgi:putative transposase
MARKTCRRHDAPGHAHELTFSCHGRLPLLARDRTRLWFVEAVEAARGPLAFDVWAYVLMPEHVHLLVRPRDPAHGVSAILHRLKRHVARRAIAFLEREASDWLPRLTVTGRGGMPERRFWLPGGGYDRNIVEPRTLHRVIAYIHQNPVRRGLATHPEAWTWSSAPWYAGVRPVPLEMDATLPTLDAP